MKKIICILLIFVLALGFTGCSNVDENGANNISSSIYRIYYEDGVSFFSFVDEETGVNYLVFIGANKGGMTPRLNADGTLYVTGGNE